MTDRELLERAAKAAGIEFWFGRDGRLYTSPPPNDGKVAGVEWNPLTDDGDALRLAVTRKMTIAWEPMRNGWSVGAIVQGEFRWLAFDEDCRRAIVRAAAMGEQE